MGLRLDRCAQDRYARAFHQTGSKTESFFQCPQAELASVWRVFRRAYRSGYRRHPFYRGLFRLPARQVDLARGFRKRAADQRFVYLKSGFRKFAEMWRLGKTGMNGHARVASCKKASLAKW